MSRDTQAPTQQGAPIPPDEPRRLAALRRYDILDTPPERAFDDLTALASELCGAPIALVSLVDADRQWFKSKVGLDARQTPRSAASFCAHAILDDQPLVVPDATADSRFADNPLVTGEPGIRFYAGAPLITNDGLRLGTLCVIDTVPRRLEDLQLRALQVLGRQVVMQLEMRSALARLERRAQELEDERQSLQDALRKSLDGERDERAQHSFLSHVTHELRTPLSGIIGLSELMLGDSADGDLDADEARDNLDLINRAGHHMLALVNGLLDLAALDGGAVPDLEPVDVPELVEAVIGLVRPLAQRGGNELRMSIDDAVSSVVTDATKLRQILLNLLSNACNYTQDGTVTLRITRGDDVTCLSVIDTGVGMTEEQLARLYDHFTRFSSSHVRPTHGTGLGMAITKALCDRIGARILVDSAPGKGTRFTVEIPTTSARSG